MGKTLAKALRLCAATRRTSIELMLRNPRVACLHTATFSSLLVLITLSDAIGQTPAKAVLVIRNVQISDGPDKPLQKVDVLVSGGVVRRVDATTRIPIDAISIDGGGNIVSIKADGSIYLTQVQSAAAPVASLGPVIIKVPEEETASFREAVLDTSSRPDKTSPGVTSPAVAAKQSTQQTPTPSAQQPAAENLAQDVTDPTAPLTTITFQNRYVPSHWGIDDDLNEFSLQIALPYKMAGKRQIFRAILPYLTDTPFPEKRGAGDISLANITLFPQKGWVFAAGGVVSLGSNKGPGIDTFAAGPAIAAITKKGKFLFGFLNQNLFSFGGDVKISQLQPIVSYTLNQKVSFAIGDAQITVDWNKSDLVALPLSFQTNYIAMLGKQPVRLFFNPQYSVINSVGQRKWTVGGGFALIIR